MSSLEGQVALVLGGESGIGLAISEALAAAGATVAIAGILADAGTDAVARIGARASFQTVDVRVAGQVDAVVSGTAKSFGRLDILVYSVGVADGFSNIVETTNALWDEVIDINLRGCFFACRAALPIMQARQFGRIVNIASIASLRPSSNGASYVAAKHGMIGLTRHAAANCAHDGITVNAVCPGVIQTDIRANSARILGAQAPDMARGIGASPDGYKRFVPAGRRGEAAEVAAMVLYLVSPGAAYVTGQVIAIDGGWSAT